MMTHNQAEMRGWIVVGVTFMCGLIIFGNLKALGVLLIAMTDDMNSQLWLIGWIAVLYSMARSVAEPIGAAISRAIGPRATVMLGGLLTSVGFIGASQATNVVQLFVLFVLIAGFGSACCWCVCLSATASHFKERFALACSIATMGIPCGFMLYGPVTQVFSDIYGWRGATLLVGAIAFHMVAGGALVVLKVDDNSSNTLVTAGGDDYIQSLESIQASPNRWTRFCNVMGFAVLKDVRVVLIIGTWCCMFNSAWVVYMIPMARVYGVSDTKASFLPTVYGAASILGKALSAFLNDKRIIPYLACVVAALLGAVFFAGASAYTYIELVALAWLTGLSSGLLAQLNQIMTRQLCDDERMVNILGFIGLFAGIAGSLGALLGIWIYEWTGSFKGTMVLFGTGSIMSMPLYVAFARVVKLQ